MKAVSVLHRRLCAILSALLMTFFLLGCSTLSAGKKYTLAKVNRDLSLIEPHRVIETTTQNDGLDKEIKDYMSIVLNGGYLRYLESVGQPEVAVFAQVRIRPSDALEEDLLWEEIFLHSEDKNSNIAMNKDSHYPFTDLTLLPAIEYDGEEIIVSLHVIELDQEDNRRALQLVNTAASVAASFKPAAGAEISIFQTALQFLIANNADDIEFQYEFVITDSEGPYEYTLPDGTVKRISNVLQPRVAKYGVIKTEHGTRLNFPSTYWEFAGHGIRYIAAEVLRFGTLGFLNWSMWEGLSEVEVCRKSPMWWGASEHDTYTALLGRPFGIHWEAQLSPEFHNSRGNLVSEAWADRSFELRGNSLYLVPTNQPSDEEEELFEDQGYMIFTVHHPSYGRDIDSLVKFARQAKKVERLGIRTTQLTAAEQKPYIDAIANSLIALAETQQAKKQLKDALDATTSTQGIRLLRANFASSITLISKRITTQTQSSFIAGLNQFASRMGDARSETLKTKADASKHKLVGPSEFQPANAEALPLSVDITIAHDQGTTIAAHYRLKGNGPFASIAGISKTDSPIGAYSVITIPGLLPAVYDLLVVSNEDPSVHTLFSFKVKPVPSG